MLIYFLRVGNHCKQGQNLIHVEKTWYTVKC